MNRVLTLEEVLALHEGARVWVEAADDQPEEWSEIHTVVPGLCLRKRLRDSVGAHFDPDGLPEQYGVVYRVWSLPAAPTPDELAAWPWEAQ